MDKLQMLDNGMVRIFGNYMDYYNENDCIDNTCPISFTDCTLEHIDEDCMILEINDKDTFYIKDGDEIILDKAILDFTEKEAIDESIDVYIEHLEEMKEIKINVDNINYLIQQLKLRGYNVKINPSCDYLILIEE